MYSWPMFYTGPAAGPPAHFHAMSVATKTYSANTVPLAYPMFFDFPHVFQVQRPVFNHTQSNMGTYPAVVGTMPFVPASCYSPVPDIVDYASLGNTVGPVSSLLLNLNSCSMCEIHARTPIDTDVITFLAKVVEEASMHESTLITTMYYVDKCLRMSGATQLTRPCGRCVFATCAVLATKYLSDDCVSVNSTWAKILGLPVSLVSAYERELLRLFEYNLNVPRSDYTFLEQRFRNDWASQYLNVQRISDISSEEDDDQLIYVPESTATHSFEYKPVKKPRGKTEVDPAIFVTAEYQDILKDLYAMN
eukprot:comp21898_c0_seq1/m.31391 comp21898_c0_seq1/g.31391  ORF comp21898_c0_seq1/g.31391 comp21898_c0_seq1/m.31391 type:complete len:306 (-) comp21898_c0_seq1:624-1541(-)